MGDKFKKPPFKASRAGNATVKKEHVLLDKYGKEVKETKTDKKDSGKLTQILKHIGKKLSGRNPALSLGMTPEYKKQMIKMMGKGKPEEAKKGKAIRMNMGGVLKNRGGTYKGTY